MSCWVWNGVGGSCRRKAASTGRSCWEGRCSRFGWGTRGLDRVWGCGRGSDYRKLSGGRAVEWEGGLFGVHTGVDVEWGSGFVGGVGASRFDGDVDYTDRSGGGEVRGEAPERDDDLPSVPGVVVIRGFSGVGVVGLRAGEGEDPGRGSGPGEERHGVPWGCARGSVRVYTGAEGTATVDLKGEGQTTRTSVEDNGELLAGLSVGTHRLRVAVEGKGRLMLEGGGSLEPSLELGSALGRW